MKNREERKKTDEENESVLSGERKEEKSEKSGKRQFA